MLVCAVDSPVGRLLIAEEAGRIVRVDVTEEILPPPETLPQQACAAQLAAYFAGERRVFDVPAEARGTPFQQAVWAELVRIPWGETRTYGEIAAAMGRPSASRAVGGAIHRNPLLILIPCHRVVGKTGLTGFRAGLDVKRRLLLAEGRQVQE